MWLVEETQLAGNQRWRYDLGIKQEGRAQKLREQAYEAGVLYR